MSSSVRRGKKEEEDVDGRRPPHPPPPACPSPARASSLVRGKKQRRKKRRKGDGDYADVVVDAAADAVCRAREKSNERTKRKMVARRRQVSVFHGHLFFSS